MNPVLLKADFLALVWPLTGLTIDAVSWDLDGQNIVNEVDDACIRFRVRGLAPKTIDYRKRVMVDGVLQTQIIGQRVVRMTAIAEDYGAGKEAHEILDLLRTNLFQESVIDALDAIGLALQTTTTTIDLPTAYDTRVVNAASFDLFFAGVSVTDLAAPADGTPGYIATVNGNNRLPLTLS